MALHNQGKGNQGGKSESKQGGQSQRGFASMDPAQQREIASEGGRAAHQAGTAHEFTSEEARKAGHLSHKNDASRSAASSAGPGNRGSESSSKTRGGSQSGSGNQGSESGSKSRGGTVEQHAKPGRQSHKNQK